jgi:hypothetical protein
MLENGDTNEYPMIHMYKYIASKFKIINETDMDRYTFDAWLD